MTLAAPRIGTRLVRVSAAAALCLALGATTAAAATVEAQIAVSAIVPELCVISAGAVPVGGKTPEPQVRCNVPHLVSYGSAPGSEPVPQQPSAPARAEDAPLVTITF